MGQRYKNLDFVEVVNFPSEGYNFFVGMTQRKVSRRCQELLLDSLLRRLSKSPNIILLACTILQLYKY